MKVLSIIPSFKWKEMPQVSSVRMLQDSDTVVIQYLNQDGTVNFDEEYYTLQDAMPTFVSCMKYNEFGKLNES